MRIGYANVWWMRDRHEEGVEKKENLSGQNS
jgi:hypothetical protein